MKFKCEIDCDNEAFWFEDGGHTDELSALLEGISEDVCSMNPINTSDKNNIYDSNGNYVGSWRFENEIIH